MAPSPFFHPFQPTRNNQQHCGCYTSQKKIPHIRVIPGRTSVRSDSVFLFLKTKEEFAKAMKKKKRNVENKGAEMRDQDLLLPDPALTLT